MGEKSRIEGSELPEESAIEEPCAKKEIKEQIKETVDKFKVGDVLILPAGLKYFAWSRGYVRLPVDTEATVTMIDPTYVTFDSPYRGLLVEKRDLNGAFTVVSASEDQGIK